MIRNLTITGIIVCVLFCAADVYARRGGWNSDSRGWGRTAPYCALYDPGSIEKLSGEVTGIATKAQCAGCPTAYSFF